MTPRRAQLKIVIVGHVDHGKSTLIGRLLHDTGALPDGKYEELLASSQRRGMPIEWSFALDAFQAERDQAITIDTSQIWFRSASRDYVIIDAPGHREFLKNMVSGAAQADAAVLVIDAQEGIQDQSRRHAYLLHLLGLRQIVVAVNKMDLVGYDANRFAAVAEEITQYLRQIGLAPNAIVPLAARHGVNLTQPAADMPWHAGPTLLAALDGFELRPPATQQPLRLPVQDVYRFDERRIIVGRVESGILRAGDTLLFSPSNRTATVTSIECWGAARAPLEAKAGEAVGLTLDQPVYVDRGDIASHASHAPQLTTVFRLTLFWLNDKPLTVGNSYKMKLATSEVPVTVQAIERVVDTDSLAGSTRTEVRRNEVAEIILRTAKQIAVDEASQHAATGRVVLMEGFQTVGGGLISMRGYPDQRQQITPKGSNLYAVDHLLPRDERERRNGHKGAVLWFTGLSGSGKSTISMRVEQLLFARGMQVYVLDGDNVRKGLNADLGFSPSDRAENIRRVGEVAALFADAGVICITAFISPYQADRDRARQAIPDRFHEIYIQADVAACEQRDPKGLYKKARAGEIKDFTGISAPYEIPAQPELAVPTERQTIDESVAQIIAYVDRFVRLH